METISQQPTPVGAHGGSLNKDSHLFRTLFLTHTATSEGWVGVCVCVCVRSCLGVSAVCLGVAPITAQPLPIHKYGTLFPGTLHVPFPLPEHPFPSPTLIFARRSLAHSSRAGEGVFFPRKPALNTPPWLLRGPSAPRPLSWLPFPPALVLWAVTSGSCVHGVLKCGLVLVHLWVSSTGRDPIRGPHRPHRGPENAC